MTKTREQRILELAAKMGLLRPKDLVARKLPREYLSRMAAAGTLQAVGRGLYRLPQAEFSAFHSLAEVGAAVPKGVLCLLSALRFHDLTTQLPPDVWVAVSGPVWRPTKTPFPVRYVHMAGNSFLQGVESHVVDKVRIRVFSPAKTVADCFKYRNKIGLDVALEALRDYLRKYRGGADELWRFAKICRVSRIIRPYLETMS
jgi:predicted transcriptional regulator of viral defense system